ncbi:pseudouridine synthase [Subtercola frigoramans]|uniref:Pseudouridine synthase n=1 Tax=Subtercola frigoramans TaxID=120298 RepID=A0ABS2L656_9MICO|nr:pseudouridine synthase [Subtercola frigoramans]MBM7472559.1 23S rRNA pseudouridine2605 synthase/16S rRNA pseudouridine516 synthase [Subtercola frigoramans]
MTNFTDSPDFAGRSGEGRAGEQPDGVRLQKVLASAGVASRRVSEDLITAGRVRVNGEIVRELGRRINPETDKVAVDNQAVQLDTTKRYVMLNKPVGIVSSLTDQYGRPDLSRYTSQFEERLFNVGRLDAETSGLLILTNDGELAHVLAHPSFGVMKTYIAQVEGRVTAQTIAKLIKGVELDDGPIVADKARLLDSSAGNSLVEVTLHSGRNRIVRRMLEEVGHPVLELVRRQFGPLHLGSLKAGELRDLSRDELGALLTLSRVATAPGADHADVTSSSAAGPGRSSSTGEKKPARSK